ncbi:helix-turn-helix domain-containing protein [Micromonospora ureilytica]|uniref:Excisionase family DNA binding protein n=1 Tax=Micromonospora ureilytica TaxID=709868 RepID=A0ABS0JKI6_9ACTN|nr:helix-turn-helix domain-containing protein [Micromonospora ureilytica]MBG6067578.1 excisionase family DNA binding protein [Micromonospora ureilytica]WSR58964.1 helix-turn-helix domain-containing protein [Micromonospora ureilytica]
MTAAALKEETYLPEADGQVAQVHDFMQAHETAGRGPVEPRYFLAGATPGDRVELPAEIYGVLRQVVEALQQGFAVTVAPRTLKLTTQQAADLLGVSRPTVVKLLDEGKIPFERLGTHRRVLLPDLLAYRTQRRAEQYAALEATSMDIDDEEDLDAVTRRLREARSAVARRRRGLTG